MMRAKDILNAAHGTIIFGRRVRILARHLAHCLPRNARVLDVGTGDGSIAAAVMYLRPDVQITGIDVLRRPIAQIPVRLFDGNTFPFEKCSFDAVSFIDVLHHSDNPSRLLGEASRVSRGCVVIKDHLCSGLFANATLRLMDWVGNYGHEVRLPYNYLSEGEWQRLFALAGLAPDHWLDRLNLYPMPFTWLFDRRLHFVTRLSILVQSQTRSSQ